VCVCWLSVLRQALGIQTPLFVLPYEQVNFIYEVVCVTFSCSIWGRHVDGNQHALISINMPWGGFSFHMFDMRKATGNPPVGFRCLNVCSSFVCLPSIFHIRPTTYLACTHKKIQEPQLRFLFPNCMELLLKNLHNSSISLLSFKSMSKTHLFRS